MSVLSPSLLEERNILAQYAQSTDPTARNNLAQRIFDEYACKIRLLFLANGFQNADADNLLQDTFKVVFSKAHTFKGMCNPQTWINKIAMNHMRSARRVPQFQQKISYCDLNDESMQSAVAREKGPVDTLLLTIERSLLAVLMKGLPKHYVIAMQMAAEGMSNQAIADSSELKSAYGDHLAKKSKEQITAGMVKNFLNRGREALRKALLQCGIHHTREFAA